ncbi:MAG: hypothetical protein NC120_11780, partial [Ruminococcus sp.]|nr:hypothetical protein [Ruminococcus sp.]
MIDNKNCIALIGDAVLRCSLRRGKIHNKSEVVTLFVLLGKNAITSHKNSDNANHKMMCRVIKIK